MANSISSAISQANRSHSSISAGFVQFNPVLGDLKANREQLEPLIAKAASADLIVLPELANSGYNFQSRAEAFKSSEDLKDSAFLQFLTQQAQAYGLHIVAGINEREGKLLYNSAILVGPSGLLGKYRKMHLFMNEFDIFEKGDSGLPVFDIMGCRIGILICFDWMFPEVWQKLAMKGADLICHPSNLVLPYAQQAVPVHALINRVFAITANRFGTEHGVTFSGASIVSDPLGKIVYRAKINESEVRFFNLDLTLARNKKITGRNHAFDDRRPELY